MGEKKKYGPYGHQKKWRRKLRREALAAYGIKCNCCGEGNEKFLTIDHMEGNGRTHRKQQVGSMSSDGFYSWLRKNGYPAGFQILCFNCNCGRSKNGGICPHLEQ